jgi:hypothetical protein
MVGSIDAQCLAKADRDAAGLFTKAVRHTIKVAAAALKSVASDVPSSLLIVDGIVSGFLSKEPKAWIVSGATGCDIVLINYDYQNCLNHLSNA